MTAVMLTREIIDRAMSRTNISDKTRRCVGTEESSCNITIDASAGRMRCSSCRLEQQAIDQRRRNAINNSQRRKKDSERVRLRNGSTATLAIKVVDGISGLPRMGIARCAFTAFLVILDGGEWREIDEIELDQRIAEKTRKYLDHAETVLKTGV